MLSYFHTQPLGRRMLVIATLAVLLSYLAAEAATELYNLTQNRKARFSAYTGHPAVTGTGALFIAEENSDKPTYIAAVSSQANTAASHAITIESGASKVVRILRVCIKQVGSQTTAGQRILLLERTTAAGTAGAVTAEVANATTAALARLDTNFDSAFTGIVRAKPTTLGTQGATLDIIPIFVPAALAAFTPFCRDYGMDGVNKMPRSLSGTANGIALRDPGAAGGANFAASIMFMEEDQ